MKKYLSILILMVYGVALASPPQPRPPGPPGLPIDNGFIIAVFIAITLIYFFIKKFKIKSVK
jgi:hypothetical protein